MIHNETEIEDLLSRPSGADIESVRELAGDLLILGAGGKMGPTLAMRAARAFEAAHLKHKVIAVARFTNRDIVTRLSSGGINIIASDLLSSGALAGLPDAPNVIFMAAMKFGTTGAEHLTWAMNTYLPGLVAERYKNSRIVAFSTGNVYPLVPVTSGGATEDMIPMPVGEYAQSALGRERMFAYGSDRYGTPGVLLRLNYACELRYGVLLDIGQKVFHREPVDLRMGMVNVIWQGDANSVCLRSLSHCQSPPLVLNLTGPETLSVRWIAEQFGLRFGVEPSFDGAESPSALLNNSARMCHLFGYPTVTPLQMIDRIAEWIGSGGTTLGKPTHFETRDGRF